MNFRYTPFEKDLSDLSSDDLATLINVHEGWYVEYKSKLVRPRDLAKTFSSFANQQGGWLFIGVSEDRSSHVAASFPGIPNSDVTDSLEALRNASKDLISPDVFYNSRVFEGPVESLGLETGRSIVIVQIPQGADCPYIHNDGRIYRRIADASDPKPETDRSRLDMLIERGKAARSRLADRVTRIPTVSKGEENQCYIHLSVMSDPYETLNHWYSAGFSTFSKLMRQGNIKFDNHYAKAGGFIARQVNNNDPYSRILTWEFSRHCHSFITVPVPLASPGSYGASGTDNEIFDTFMLKIQELGLNSARVLDLNLVLIVLMSIIRRHRFLVWQARVKGPFYVKANLENIWRTVPFVDLPEYLDHLNDHGIAVIQDTEVLVPDGTSLENFVFLPERDVPKSESLTPEEMGDPVGDAIKIGIHIFEAFGIPQDVLKHASDLFFRHFKINAIASVD